MRLTILGLVLCLFLSLVGEGLTATAISKEQMAADKEAFVAAPVDSFRFVGNALACKMASPDDDYACLVIGPHKIGATYAPPNEPWQEFDQGDGVVGSVHPIAVDENHQAYWVIGHKEGKVTSVQLTGDYPDVDYAFSSIRLTDPQSKVVQILGPRYVERKVDEIGGVMWDYHPFDITIEFVGGKVYSIRISG